MALNRTLDRAYYARLSKHIKNLSKEIESALKDENLTEAATLGVVYFNCEAIAKWCEELQHSSDRDLSNL